MIRKFKKKKHRKEQKNYPYKIKKRGIEGSNNEQKKENRQKKQLKIKKRNRRITVENNFG